MLVTGEFGKVDAFTYSSRKTTFMGPFDDYRKIVDQNLIAVSTNTHGDIIYASQAFCTISGYTPALVQHKNLSYFRHADTSDALYDSLWKTLCAGKSWHGELKFSKKGNGYFWVRARFFPNFETEDEQALLGFTAIMHDISDRKRCEVLASTIEDEERQLSEYLSMIDDYVITSTTDVYGTITSVSSAFCEISGYSKQELIGQNHNIVRHADMPADLYKDLWNTVQRGDEWKGEVKNRKKDGSFYWVDVNIKPNMNVTGEIVGYTAVRQDITDKKRIEELTITDELTGAYNRRYYNQILNDEINRARRNHKWLGFLMVDADNFKKYNDSYGHQAGDDVLKSITKALTDTFRRGGDFVFRLGGEEFAVLYETEKQEQLLLVAERSLQAMYDMNIGHTGNPPHDRVTLSMGLMCLDPEQTYVNEEIYKYADEALYHAKQNGRNRIELVESSEDDVELF